MGASGKVGGPWDRNLKASVTSCLSKCTIVTETRLCRGDQAAEPNIRTANSFVCYLERGSGCVAQAGVQCITGAILTTGLHWSFALLGSRPRRVRPSIGNLVVPRFCEVPILMENLVRTPNRHRALPPRSSGLKRSSRLSLASGRDYRRASPCLAS